MTLKEHTLQILVESDVDPNTLGFGYLLEAVEICHKDNEMLKIVTKLLYPEIGKRNKVSAGSVERCMRYALTHSEARYKRISSFISYCLYTFN